MEEEKFGKMVLDGKIVDLDNATTAQLEGIVATLQQREAAIQKQIDDTLGR